LGSVVVFTFVRCLFELVRVWPTVIANTELEDRCAGPASWIALLVQHGIFPLLEWGYRKLVQARSDALSGERH
jgi:hypothetical protein